jgi:iron complex outermembrane receptor protein
MKSMSKIGFFVAAVLAAGAASAQTEGGLEEVVITAQKRVGTLQDVPVAVTAVSGEMIENAQVRDAKDLQQMVPSLTVTTAASSTNTTFSIRSLGTSTFNPGLEGSVGIFVDGVYFARQGAAINDFMSLDRVEVLRGPQATLFGRNTPAGVVSFVTKAPDFDFNGAAEVTAGNLSSKIVRGTVTGPITDTLAYRFDGNWNQRDGIVTNVRDGRDLNDRDRYSMRGQLLSKVSEDTTIRFIADFAKISETCCAAPFSFYAPVSTIVIPALGGTLLPADPFAGKIAIDNPVYTNTESKGLSVQVDHKYSGFDLTSITAFRQYDENQNFDADFTTLDLAGDRLVTQSYKTFTQEIRLASTGENKLDWQLGGFFYDNKLRHDNRTPYGSQLRAFADGLTRSASAPSGAITLVEQLTGTPAGTFLGTGQGLRRENYAYNTKSTSGFGQVDFHVNDKLTLTIGARYTKESKNMNALVDIFDPFSAINMVTFGRQVIFSQAFTQTTGLAATPANIAAVSAANPAAIAQLNAVATAYSTDPARNPFLGLTALQFNPPATVPSFRRNRSENNLSGNFIVGYDATDSTNVYASWSRGFKAGGFNLSANASITGVYEFEPEIATNIELGLKTKLFDNTTRLNVALFKQDLKDFQENIFTGSGFGLANAGKVALKGAEVEFASRPVDYLTLGGGFTYMFESKYDSFTANSCYPAQAVDAGIYANAASVPSGNCGRIINTTTGLPITVQNSSGKDRNTPQWIGNLNGQLTAPMAGNLGFLNASVYYVSEQNYAANQNPIRAVGAITLLNASAGIRSQDGKWSVEVWSRNLTDEKYTQGNFESVGQPGSVNSYLGEPRTYGVTLRTRF